jgi:hypothetical protein
VYDIIREPNELVAGVPGVGQDGCPLVHYPTEDAYVAALGNVIKTEYREKTARAMLPV